MGKSHETYNKKEKEKKKQKKRQEKEERKSARQQNSNKGKGLEGMLAYVDENGNISDTPPDPKKKTVINAEDIPVGVQKQPNLPEVDEYRTGVVSFYNESKGYGFIKDDISKESIFVHVNSLSVKIKENDKLKYKIVHGDRGPNAAEVSLA